MITKPFSTCPGGGGGHLVDTVPDRGGDTGNTRTVLLFDFQSVEWMTYEEPTAAPHPAWHKLRHDGEVTDSAGRVLCKVSGDHLHSQLVSPVSTDPDMISVKWE